MTSDLILRHYDEKEIVLDRSWQYSNDPMTDRARSMGSFWKPSGLWVSIENGGHSWKDWCEAEEFGLGQLTHVHEVKLKDDARILRINNEEELKRFHQEYFKVKDVLDLGADLPESHRTYKMGHVDWPRLIQEGYQGIIITPYLWSMRLDMEVSWYYIWDCASGCIWDLDAIAEFRLIEKNLAEDASKGSTSQAA